MLSRCLLVVSVMAGASSTVARGQDSRAASTPSRQVEEIFPVGYVGGQLTTNTVLSRSVVGLVSDPEGYTQPSIVTIRLWKRE